MHRPTNEELSDKDSGNGGDITGQLAAIQISEPTVYQASGPGHSSSSGVASDHPSSSSDTTTAVRRVIVEGSNVPIPKADLPYQLQTLATRPGEKIEGTKRCKHFLVEANFYQLRISQDIPVEQYNIEISTRFKNEWRVENKKERVKPLFWMVVSQNQGSFPVPQKMIYNDNNLLYLQKDNRIKDQYGRLLGEFELLATKPPKRPDRSGRMPNTRPDVRMKIKFTGRVIIKATPEKVQERNEMTTFIDLLITMRLRCPSSDASRFFVSHGHSLFYAPETVEESPFCIDLGDAKQALCGVHSAVKVGCEEGILLNVDLQHSIFSKPRISLIQYICERYEGRPMNEARLEELKGALKRSAFHFLGNRDLRARVHSWIKGMAVYTMHTGTKRLKIGGLTNESAENLYFRLENNSEISVAKFFRDKYDIILEYPRLPCVYKDKNRQVCVPLELCCTDLKPERIKVMSTAQRGQFIRSIARDPFQRNQVLDAICNPQEGAHWPEHLSHQDEWMAEYGVELDKKPLNVLASLLPTPRLVYGQNQIIHDVDNTGEWKVTRAFRANQANIKLAASLLFIGREYCEPGFSKNHVPFMHLMGTLTTFGVQVGRSQPVEIKTWWSQWTGMDLKQKLISMKNAILCTYKDHPDVVPLIVCVFPRKCAGNRFGEDSSLLYNEYAMLKLLADTDVNVHCQGMLMKTYMELTSSGEGSTTINIALKIMGKIGVTPYKLDNNLNDDNNHKAWAKLVSQPTLILGVDVTHPGVAERKEAEENNTKASSVACVIGNVDKDISKFEASYRVQHTGQEMILNMFEEFSERLSRFSEHSGVVPKHIIVYRDGVSESMFQKTLYEEKECLKKVFTSMDKDYKPTLTYIVMTKRHHARFTAMNSDTINQQPPHRNLRPGTLIESKVTSRTFFDYFLYSHHGAMGTSRPNHYYVLYNDWEESSPYQFQHITFALAYNYIRCTKSVSQPAPVMYAHLGAQRAKYYLEAQGNLFEERRFEEQRSRHVGSVELNQMKEEDKRKLTSLKVSTKLKGMIFV